MTIKPGDVYWVPVREPQGEVLEIIHPHVVIEENLNHNGSPTVTLCALTTNMRKAAAPGNVLLEVGEANLPKQSIVVVSQVFIVATTQLGNYIGSLSEERVQQVLAGMKFVQAILGNR